MLADQKKIIMIYNCEHKHYVPLEEKNYKLIKQKNYKIIVE